jgi:hypothetical protein
MQTVRLNPKDARELAQQAALLYVSIGNAIDPTQARDVLQGKADAVVVVIKYDGFH